MWLKSLTGTRLHGWFIPVEAHSPAVVVLHGWGGNSALMPRLAPHLHEAGFHAVLQWTPATMGSRSTTAHLDATVRRGPRSGRVGWLRDHPAVTSVGVIGHSVGAGAAILSGSRSDMLDAIVSVAAPATWEMVASKIAAVRSRCSTSP